MTYSYFLRCFWFVFVFAFVLFLSFLFCLFVSFLFLFLFLFCFVCLFFSDTFNMEDTISENNHFPKWEEHLFVGLREMWFICFAISLVF